MKRALIAAAAAALLAWLAAWPGAGCHLRGGALAPQPGPGKQVRCVLR